MTIKVLVACEYSATVRDAFRKLGHDAHSVDILPTEGDPKFHFQCDIFDVLYRNWDLVIAHPPCTYLTNSGVRWLHTQEGRWENMRNGAEMFRKIMECPAPKIAVENPIMHRYAVEIVGRKQDQVIQPWMFGHMESKGTGLWLKNLPLLRPTSNVRAQMLRLPESERNRIHYASPGPDRWKLRSKTYKGIANAMAEQWGGMA